MKDNNVTRKDLESLIRIALKRLYDNDNYLICKQTNFDAVHNSERGIVFRFGIYLDKLKLPVLHEYDIDVEYDRNIDCKKCVPGWENGCYPDIIIHKRGTNTDNLLILEFKTWWNRNQDKDKMKIQRFLDKSGEYCYRYDATIMIGKTCEECDVNWIK